MLLFTLHWRGGRLQPTLTDSLGQAVGPGSPGVFFSTTETLASILVQNPLPGQWSVSAYGADLPDGKTAYQVVLSVRAAAITPTPQPRTSTGRVQLASPQAPVMGMMLFVILTAAAVLVITQRSRRGIRRRAVARGPVARLVGVSGAVAGRTDWIQDDFIIGSGPGCSLALVDPSVSYQHVRIRFFAGRWFIQGLDFRNETRVNGVPVRASALRDGDRVKIGPYEFIFQIR
jgi:hypothetical protein